MQHVMENRRSVNTIGQRGTSLVEVLVTILITSIGILGVASLQAVAMKMTHSSYLRTQATLLASDLAERMLSNPSVRYAVSKNYPGTRVKTCKTANSSFACSPTQLRDQDIFQWVQAARAALPNAIVQVAGSGNETSLHTITIEWNDSSTDQAQSLVYQVR